MADKWLTFDCYGTIADWNTGMAGALREVAGSGAGRLLAAYHRADTVPRLAMPDPTAAHPDEVLLIAPAGTVVVFNSHLWHGGTVNHTDRPRRALHSYFARRERGQQTDQKKYLRPETRADLSPAACFILDVD